MIERGATEVVAHPAYIILMHAHVSIREHGHKILRTESTCGRCIIRD